MADAFENILGQPQVRDYLRRSVKSGRVTQAYLFTGPAGSNKTTAAYALAQGLLCEHGGCGVCDVCMRIKRRKHPDVRYYAPEGTNEYLIAQIREIVSDSSLAPIEGSRKIYILDRVDLLGVSAANAFLKLLEEPPEDTVFILLGRTVESVLPTIVSRCQVVPFRHIPASEAAGILVQNTGCTREQARIAIESCGGSVTRGIEFLKNNEGFAFRNEVLNVITRLPEADPWDVLGMAANLVSLAKAPLDSVRETQERELQENADFLGKSAMRQIEARNDRLMKNASRKAFMRITSIISSFLRDVLMVCAETPELIINVDVRAQIEDAARRTDEAHVVRALSKVDHCNEAIACNVSPETSIDALLYEIREALYGAYSPREASI